MSSLADLTPIIEQLRFLRPDWFYGFLPLTLFVVLMSRRKTANRSWKSVCDRQLLPHVLTQVSDGASRLPLWLIAITVSLSLVALAGPVWKKLPQPVFREASALVIALDLSQSMNATDIKPSRLERAKLKLLDMLDAHREGQTALLVYAAGAFTVTPLTDDGNTIKNLVPALSTDLMPAQGSNTTAALTQASDLLRQAGVAKGDVLLITDGLDSDGQAAVEKIHASGHRVSILGVGTAEGSPIPLSGGFLTDADGAIVIPRLQADQLKRAALSGGGLYAGMRVDDSDISRLEKLFDSARAGKQTEQTELNADTWREEGPWLLLPVLLLVMLWPRRGWLMLLVIFILPLPQPAHAFGFGVDLDHLWRSPDQQGKQAFDAGDAAQAAQHFENPKWKAAAYYRAGDYAKAGELLQQADSSEDHYNRGNALARMGNYPEAIAAYQQALEKDTDNADARYNLELVKKQMQQQNQQGQPSEQDSDTKKQQQDQPQQDQQEQQQAQQDQQQSPEQDSDTKNQQQQQDQPQQDQQGQQQQQAQQPQQDQQQQHDDQAEQNQASADQSDETTNEQQGDEQAQQQQDEFGEESEDNVQQRFTEQMQQENQQQDDQQQAQSEDAEQKPDQEQPEEQTQQTAQAMPEMRENDKAEMTEDQYATEQLLRRIPDDPGGLMRRKFIYQYQQMPNQRNSEQPW